MIRCVTLCLLCVALSGCAYDQAGLERNLKNKCYMPHEMVARWETDLIKQKAFKIIDVCAVTKKLLVYQFSDKSKRTLYMHPTIIYRASDSVGGPFYSFYPIDCIE